MTESLMQRIEKAEKELAAIKAEATKPKVDISKLEDGTYICQTCAGDLRIFFVLDSKPTYVMGSSSFFPVPSCRGPAHEVQRNFDTGFYHSLKRVTSLEPLL